MRPLVALILAAGVVVCLGPASAPAAEAPNLSGGRLVIYLGQLGGRGCTIDRRLAARLRVAARRLYRRRLGDRLIKS